MSVRLLRQFLLERGYVDAAGLARMTTYDEARSSDLGSYALAFQYLSAEQTETVRRLAAERRATFAETARATGLLDDVRIRSLEQARDNHQTELADVAVALALLSRTDVERATREFMDEQTRLAEATMSIPANVPDRATAVRVAEMFRASLEEAWRIHSELVQVSADEGDVALGDLCAEISVNGDWNGIVAIGVDAAVCRLGATRILGTSLRSHGEEADWVRELVNVVGGHLASSLASAGKHVEISAPRTIDSPWRPSAPIAARFRHATEVGGAVVACATVDGQGGSL